MGVSENLMGPNYQTFLNIFSNTHLSTIFLKYNKTERFWGKFTDYCYEMIAHSGSDHDA